MKCGSLVLAVLSALTGLALAIDGQVGIHDPSTVIKADGKYYVWGTGGAGLVSDDGWNWRRGDSLPRRGLAPDVIHIGDTYYVYVANNVGAQPAAEVHLLTNKALDPQSKDYKWKDAGVVVSSDGVEDCNAIDPGVFSDPKTGRLWLTYGSYFGYIRLTELDPRTGLSLHPHDKPRELAVNCEASDMMYHDGWYYLFATHLSCCAGTDSGYNIRVGRSRKVTGPFLDAEGLDMIQGGGKLFLGSNGRTVGPGHFGLLDEGDGVQKFSMHWEADMDRGGASVLDIRPLWYRDGWPQAGENLKEGTYDIESLRTGTSVELAVEGVPVGGRRRRPVGGPPPRPPSGPQAGPPSGPFGGSATPIPSQEASQVSAKWPSGSTPVRLGNYQCQAHQKWTISPAVGRGGYPGMPFFKITVAGDTRTLAATSDGELEAQPLYTGAPEQLWRIELLPDDTWRLMPQRVPGSSTPMALTAIGAGSVTLEKLDPMSSKLRFLLKTP